MEVILECRILLAQVLELIKYLVPRDEGVIVEDLSALGDDVEFVKWFIRVSAFDSRLPLLEVDDQQILPGLIGDDAAVRESLDELFATLDRGHVAIV